MAILLTFIIFNEIVPTEKTNSLFKPTSKYNLSVISTETYQGCWSYLFNIFVRIIWGNTILSTRRWHSDVTRWLLTKRLLSQRVATTVHYCFFRRCVEWPWCGAWTRISNKLLHPLFILEIRIPSSLPINSKPIPILRVSILPSSTLGGYRDKVEQFPLTIRFIYWCKLSV